MDDNEIIGVIFPVPSIYLPRFFEDNKDVFVTYSKTGKNLEPGMKIVFYASYNIRALIGEGEIQKVAEISPESLMRKYKKRLFITKEELNKYASRHFKNKKLRVFEIAHLKRYKTPVKPSRNVTVAGELLTKEKYEKIIKQQNR